MLISIITVALNSEKTIAGTIESVLAQTYNDFEYIIVDGKSTDGTLAVAESYRTKFKEKGVKYTIYTGKDYGIYDAMNFGIKKSEGSIIGLINSDDWYEPCALALAAETYEKEKFDWYFTDLNVVLPSGKVTVKKSRIRKFKTTRDWNHPTSFISKKLYNEMEYRINDLYGDYDLFLRAAKNGYKIVNKNVVTANYRFGGAGSSHSLKRVKNCIRYRYNNYRRNGYSRFYIFECLFTEIGKYIIGG